MKRLRIYTVALFGILLLMLSGAFTFVQASPNPTVNLPAYAWHTFYGANSVVHAIAVDQAGGVYVVGETRDAWLGDNNSPPLHPFTGQNDVFVMKLNSHGKYQWHTFFGSAENNAAWGVAVGGDDSVYVSGYSDVSWQGPGGVMPLHAHSTQSGDFTADAFCLKLNSAGAYQWHTFYGSIGYEGGSRVAVDPAGMVNLVGESAYPWLGSNGANPLHAHSGGLADGSNVPSTDLFVLQLKSDGSYRWHTFYGAPGSNDGAAGVATDSAHNLYVTGSSQATWKADSNASPLHAANGTNDLFVLKLNPNGAYQWHTFYGNNGDAGNAISVDSSNNVYVAGDSYRSWLGDGNTPPLHPLNTVADMFILRLNSDGVYQWHTFYGSDQLDSAADLSVNDNRVAIVGWSDAAWQGSAGQAPLHAFDSSDDSHNITILGLDSAGAYQWHTFYGPDNLGAGIAGDDAGNVYVAALHAGNWLGDNGTPALHGASSDYGFTVLSLAPALPTPTPTRTPTYTPDGPWMFCAVENQHCTFTGTHPVRFGANGSYFVKQFTNGVKCTISNFGDPAIGKPKTCQYSNVPLTPTSTPTPTLTPTITPTPKPSCPAVLNKPQPLLPPDGSVLDKARLLLTWSGDSCALRYKVTLNLGAKNGPTAQKGNTTAPQFRTKTLAPGIYFWNVSACNANNCTGSRWWQFTIN